MPPDVARECVEIFRALAIERSDALRMDGRIYRCDPDRLVTALHTAVYTRFYCGMRSIVPAISRHELLSALGSANLGGVPGQNAETDHVGMYVALGSRRQSRIRWLRLYWNVDHRSAVHLMARASAMLNRADVPFRLKVLLDVSVRRRDAVVLYLPRECWITVRDMISDICDALSRGAMLPSDTPLFTKPLRPGLGLAEDPDTGASFGTHRAGLVARAMAKSYLSGCCDEQQQWDALGDEFQGEGLSLNVPYLNAGSTDRYSL